MHFCHNAWRFVATVLRCWTFGDLAWTSGGGVEAQTSPIEGDLTNPTVKNPSFPFISFQLKIATSVCFGWFVLLFRSLVVMISALHLRSCHRFASDFFGGVDLCWGTAQPSPHRLRALLVLTLQIAFMIVHAFTLLALLCRLLQKYPHLHQLNHLPEIWWTVPKAYQDLPPDGPLPWISDNLLLPLQSLHCLLLHNLKKKSIFASSISFNCKSTVFLFRNWPFFQTILLSAKWNGILTIKWC